jgi:tRNA(Ile)-lysidine synthase TilS/MesJ
MSLQIIDLSTLRQRIEHNVTNVPRFVSSTPEVDALLDGDAVVAIGVSGGKDSVACALAVARHLDLIGHTGPRVLVHADLGRVEWKDSAPACERLAAHLGWELLTVRRKAGDMLARWQKRWENNVTRYRELSCVRLILPWSTPSMRF